MEYEDDDGDEIFEAQDIFEIFSTVENAAVSKTNQGEALEEPLLQEILVPARLNTSKEVAEEQVIPAIQGVAEEQVILAIQDVAEEQVTPVIEDVAKEQVTPVIQDVIKEQVILVTQDATTEIGINATTRSETNRKEIIEEVVEQKLLVPSEENHEKIFEEISEETIEEPLVQDLSTSALLSISEETVEEPLVQDLSTPTLLSISEELEMKTSSAAKYTAADFSTKSDEICEAEIVGKEPITFLPAPIVLNIFGEEEIPNEKFEVYFVSSFIYFYVALIFSNIYYAI